MPNSEEATATEEVKRIPVSEFLESIPPNRIVAISVLQHYANRLQRYALATPDIQLHCPSDACNGMRFFKCITASPELSETFKYQFLTYVCRNCNRFSKVYAVGSRLTDNNDGEMLKFGEWPPFGPPTPARVIALIGPDRDAFLAGRRSENQGMGIGAFAYYRRVVEKPKE
jgi:hypothetical protein